MVLVIGTRVRMTKAGIKKYGHESKGRLGTVVENNCIDQGFTLPYGVIWDTGKRDLYDDDCLEPYGEQPVTSPTPTACTCTSLLFGHSDPACHYYKVPIGKGLGIVTELPKTRAEINASTKTTADTI